MASLRTLTPIRNWGSSCFRLAIRFRSPRKQSEPHRHRRRSTGNRQDSRCRIDGNDATSLAFEHSRLWWAGGRAD